MKCEIVVSRQVSGSVGEHHEYFAQLPERKTTFAAGYDVCAFLPKDQYPDGLELQPFTVTMVPTGLYVAPEPGSTILVVARSGMAAKGVIVVNGPGVIDSDYRGEVKVLLMFLCNPLNLAGFKLQHGDRIGQLLFIPPGGIDMNVEFEDKPQTVENFYLPFSSRLSPPNSNRVGGFGSTGQ